MLLSIAGPIVDVLYEVNEAASVVAEHSDNDAEIIFGAIVDDSLGEDFRVTVIAAGFDKPRGPRGLASGSFTASQPITADSDDLDIPSFVQG